MQNITKLYTRTFIITRHISHRCIYLLIVIIITVLGLFLCCTITSFIEKYVILPFAVIFRWFRLFSHLMIYKSVPKIFAMWAFSSLPVQITIRVSFFLVFSYLFWKFICWVVSTPTKSAFFLNKIFSLLVSSRPELLLRFK